MTTDPNPDNGNVLVGARRRRMAAGASIGTLIEYYDYYLFGLGAAVVFPIVFFPAENPVAASLSSFATFAVGFLLRPIGGIVFGHIGDRLGRRTALMITVIGMGLATAGIGCLPSADTIGIAAPVLLVILRLFQGLFVGGEMGGAASLIVEHAPPGRRGLYGSLLISGAGIANVLSAGLMAALGAGPESFFMTWGWRIPFLLSLLLVLFAVLLRSRLEESDEFRQLNREVVRRGAAKATLPLSAALRHPKNVILGILMGLAQSITGYVILTYGLSYVVGKGTSKQVGFIGTMIVGALQIVVAPLWGRLSDRIGRRRTYIGACIALAIVIYPVLGLYGTDQPLLIWLGMVIGFVIPGVCMSAILQTMLSEMFDVEARTTGVNLGYQLSNTLGGGFAPLICVALAAAAGGNSWPVGIYVIGIAVISIVATVFASLRPDTPDAARLHDLHVAP
ncbi:MFS transporter [Microlunatus soli]|uniref:Predicted arabinose efflux permease, MFS family n=1 Tax=Microlunatus soli TaxID=630515 RepID=A0A1H2ANJ1_9ACTN|nr:MFS transporter [Microlunatus soli]SDT47126.1 Predicted arabinose efflux permease, MFS family [Microlunatus soli]